MENCPTTVLAGLPIARVGIAESADDFIQQALKRRGGNAKPFYSTSANGQVIALCQQDDHFREIVTKADQIHADGMSLVLFSKIFSSHPLPERVATTDLVHAVAKRAEAAGCSFYFLGGSEDVNEKTVETMRAAYPGLIVAGRRNGYFKPEEEEGVIAEIQAASPDILWIGFGVPLEQQFISRNIDRLDRVGVIKTSGGLFDFLSGKKRRAPQWLQQAGLEWAYRMFLEPRRLGKRYFTTNPIAIHALIKRSRR
jgi:exopolysaccharide biosynthesis WecB/TagA/CpsF family protein